MEDEGEDLSEEDLMDMFTNIFSYIFIKKNKKLLKQNSVDKFARLPHPSELNKKKGRKKKINSA